MHTRLLPVLGLLSGVYGVALNSDDPIDVDDELESLSANPIHPTDVKPGHAAPPAKAVGRKVLVAHWHLGKAAPKADAAPKAAPTVGGTAKETKSSWQVGTAASPAKQAKAAAPHNQPEWQMLKAAPKAAAKPGQQGSNPRGWTSPEVEPLDPVEDVEPRAPKPGTAKAVKPHKIAWKGR